MGKSIIKIIKEIRKAEEKLVKISEAEKNR